MIVGHSMKSGIGRGPPQDEERPLLPEQADKSPVSVPSHPSLGSCQRRGTCILFLCRLGDKVLGTHGGFIVLSCREFAINVNSIKERAAVCYLCNWYEVGSGNGDAEPVQVLMLRLST